MASCQVQLATGPDVHANRRSSAARARVCGTQSRTHCSERCHRPPERETLPSRNCRSACPQSRRARRRIDNFHGWRELPLMALFGRAAAVFRCPLLGVEQTSISCARRSPFDPKGTHRASCFLTSTLAKLEIQAEADLIHLRCKAGTVGAFFTEPSFQIFLVQRPRGSNLDLGHRSKSPTHSQCSVDFRTIQPAEDRAQGR
jgi:hypothetical protein